MKPPVDKPESRQTSPVTSMSKWSRAFSSLIPARDTNLGTSARTSITADAGTCNSLRRMLLPALNHSLTVAKRSVSAYLVSRFGDLGAIHKYLA